LFVRSRHISIFANRQIAEYDTTRVAEVNGIVFFALYNEVVDETVNVPV